MTPEEFLSIVEKNEKYRIDPETYVLKFHSVWGRLGTIEGVLYIFDHTPGSVKKSGLPLTAEDLNFAATVTDELPVVGRLIVLHSHRQRTARLAESLIYHEFAHIVVDKIGLKFSKSGFEAVADFMAKLVMTGGKPFKDIGWARTFTKDRKAREFILTEAPWYPFRGVEMS